MTVQSTSLQADLLRFIASDVALVDGTVDVETDLVMSGLIDSLGVMALVDWLEQRLGIVIDPTDVVIEHFESVASIIGYLRGRDDCSVE